jgi:hypothetical protein
MSVSKARADWKWALFAALLLLCLATFVIFVFHPGGFETQIGWFFMLLPGAFLAGYGSRLAPNAGQIVQLSLVFIFSFLWYFVICYGLIKICRIVGPVVRP